MRRKNCDFEKAAPAIASTISRPPRFGHPEPECVVHIATPLALSQKLSADRIHKGERTTSRSRAGRGPTSSYLLIYVRWKQCVSLCDDNDKVPLPLQKIHDTTAADLPTPPGLHQRGTPSITLFLVFSDSLKPTPSSGFIYRPISYLGTRAGINAKPHFTPNRDRCRDLWVTLCLDNFIGRFHSSLICYCLNPVEMKRNKLYICVTCLPVNVYPA
ncbi:hypothetical protein J6590_099082 [Homalodisca vitripennis]|nr:hypothetical protein J6590_099082 [Homalodisca vitripennis]